MTVEVDLLVVNVLLSTLNLALSFSVLKKLSQPPADLKTEINFDDEVASRLKSRLMELEEKRFSPKIIQIKK